MPFITPEDVVSFVIVESDLKDHLRRLEARRSRQSFVDFISQFGIHDLGELSEQQMFSLVAARNSASIVDLMRIPRGREQVSGPALSSYDLHREKTSLGPALMEFLGSTPNRDQEWEVLRDAEDIPEAVPEDLLLRRLAPQEFLRRFAEGELIRSAWLQDDLDDLHLEEIRAPEDAIDFRDASVSDQRPFGYLLLDASESMSTGRDRRDEVSRGLALAFLLSQYEAGNPTVLYLFRHDLSHMFGGEGRSAFQEAVNAILAHSHEGMTNLQGALKHLAGVMRSHSGRVDVALITDGVTRLTERPLEDVHLHTFLVGVRPEEFDHFSANQYQESLIKLRSWSDFMFRINPETMQRATIPRIEDVIHVGRIQQTVAEEMASAASTDKVRRIQSRLRNVHALIERYRETSPKDERVEQLHHEVQRKIAEFGSADPVAITMRNSVQWTQVDRDLELSLELRESRSVLEPKSESTQWNIKSRPMDYVDPAEAFRLIWQRIKSVLRRLGIRRRYRSGGQGGTRTLTP